VCARTNIDLDVEAVMRRYHLTTKRDAVNFTLRTVAAEPLGLEPTAQTSEHTVGRPARLFRRTGVPADRVQSARPR
jgi:Arc/MetJ family transcription regulator